MSDRSGYTDDCDDDVLAFGRWRAQVKSAIRGKRGQAFIRELIDSLDAMPEKHLIKNYLRKDGNVCTLGAIGARRGVDLEALDTHDYDALADVFGIAHQLIQEIEYLNDASGWEKDDEYKHRWEQMRAWAVSQLKT